MQPLQNSRYPSNALGRIWMRFPLAIRALLTGFGVSSLGVGIWALLYTNLPVPWSVLAMGTALVLYWMYFSGKWKPLNTHAFRRFCMRQQKLNTSEWIWGLVAAFLLFLFFHASWVFTFRLIEFQPEIFKPFSFANDYPAWMAWSLILIASLSAGICEEIGYRGYMQTPLERKYGPIVAISLTAIVFVLVHLHQAWANEVLVQMTVISFMIGYLAYATNSLIPGIIAHVALDIVNFSYWWSDVAGTFEHKPISMTGIDNHFIITTVVALLSMVVFFIAVRKLMQLKNQRTMLEV